MTDLISDPRYGSTMQHLEAIRRVADIGVEYWFAREIMEVFGYVEWRNFTDTIARAATSFTTNEINPSHHIVETTRMVELGSGGRRSVSDYFLTRGACYLVAMNGDPAKPEIAAAQVYFATRAREAERDQELSDDEKRLQMREKVTNSFKAVSGVAQKAGVSGRMQPVFHDARYRGLYGQSLRDVKASKGMDQKENPFDRMGALELSANDFQMNLAAKVISEEGIKGETSAIRKNQQIAERVRKTMIDSGSAPPEKLPLAEPIKEVRKRVKQTGKDRQIK